MAMRTVLLCILLCLFTLSCRVYGQNQEIETKTYKNLANINITRLALLEVRLGYERHISSKNYLRATVGIKFPLGHDSFEAVSIGLGHIPNIYPVSDGLYLALGYNYVLSPKSKFYVSAEVYYNYIYYNNKIYEYCVGHGSDSYVSLQSMQLNKYGVKLLFGKKVDLPSKTDRHLQFDFFWGIGLQRRFEDITVFKKTQGRCSLNNNDFVTIYDPPKLETWYGLYPTLHLGLSFGLPF